MKDFGKWKVTSGVVKDSPAVWGHEVISTELAVEVVGALKSISHSYPGDKSGSPCEVAWLAVEGHSLYEAPVLCSCSGSCCYSECAVYVPAVSAISFELSVVNCTTVVDIESVCETGLTHPEVGLVCACCERVVTSVDSDCCGESVTMDFECVV